MDGVLSVGPTRDFVGYGPDPPAVHWPDGDLLAVNLVVNYQEGAEYSFPDDGVNDTWGEYSFQYGPQTRDFGTEMHMEYGSRVGVWRRCRLFDQYRVNVTFNACARALERNPRLCDWLRGRSHDILGHGYRWYGPDAPGAERMTREDERTEIRTAIESVQRTMEQRLRGWMVRSFPTVHTRDLLVEEGGFLYDWDSTNDELPYFVTALGKPFLVVPYTKVYNDTRYLIHPTYATPRHFFETLKGRPRLHPRRGPPGTIRPPDDVRRDPRPMERSSRPSRRRPRFHRIRIGARRRPLYAPDRHRRALAYLVRARVTL